MSYTLTNLSPYSVALESIKRTILAGLTLVVNLLTDELIAASCSGLLSIAPSSPALTLTIAQNGQTEFTLPFVWPQAAGTYAVLLNGRALKPGTDFTVTAGSKTLTYAHSNLKTTDTLYVEGLTLLMSGSNLRFESLPIDRLDTAAQSLFARVAWSVVTGINGTSKKARLLLCDADGSPLAKQLVLRITCDSVATIKKTVTNGVGEVLSGENSNDMLIRTDEEGHFDLTVVCSTPKAITVAAGCTQASAIADCSATIDFNFAA